MNGLQDQDRTHAIERAKLRSRLLALRLAHARARLDVDHGEAGADGGTIECTEWDRQDQADAAYLAYLDGERDPRD